MKIAHHLCPTRPTSARMTGPRLSRIGRRTAAGAAFVVALSLSSTAMASCFGSGSLGGAGAAMLPFVAGGSINSLVAAVNVMNTAFLTETNAMIGAPANPFPNQEGGGVWVRGVGGQVNTKATATTQNVSFNGAPLAGDVSCGIENRLSFAGVQIGTDSGLLNWNGWDVHVGSMIGYLGGKSRDRSIAGPLNPFGGTLENSIEVPFAGFYAAATRGNFFVDGQIRLDYYQNSLNDPLVAGMFNQKLDARGYAFTANMGYRFDLGNNWFIEPSAGFAVSRVEVDPLNIAGTQILGNGITVPGQLSISDLRSTLGRFTVRGGTTIVTDSMIWQPFASASVFHEFEGKAFATFNANEMSGFYPGMFPNVAGNVRLSSIGTYGQFGVGISGQMRNSNWFGYLRADYRTGENTDGYNVSGGLRYQFSPETIAAISPFPTKAPRAPARVTAQNWNGFYIGASAGVLAGKTDFDFVQYYNASVSPRYGGFAGGGQVGYDWQFGKWVVGAELALNGSNAHGARACPNPFGTCETKMDWLGTATARVGYALWDRQIVYGRAGAAFGNTKVTASCNTGPVDVLGLETCGSSDSRTAVGWTIGYGTEFALSQNWTVRAETNYYDLGTKRFELPTVSSGPELVDVRNRGFISTVGVNYRFTPEAVVARY